MKYLIPLLLLLSACNTERQCIDIVATDLVKNRIVTVDTDDKMIDTISVLIVVSCEANDNNSKAAYKLTLLNLLRIERSQGN